MSTAETKNVIEYPESDGRPMGETDWHIDAILRLRDILKLRYRGQRIYVGSDLLVYYSEGVPRDFVVPDVFVVLDCDSRSRQTFKTWEEQRVPDVVFEISSKSTAREDQVFKPKTYARMGVRELFLFDPTAEYLTPVLQGFHLSSEGSKSMNTDDGRIHSQVLNAYLAADGTQLRLFNFESGLELLTEGEKERQIKEQERSAKEQERAGRLIAEAEIERLRDELEQLRKKL